MNVLGIIGLVCLFSALVCGVVAGILYDAAIQRYLEKLGQNPASVLFSWSGLQDYSSAKKLARRWGHNPPFLKRYGRMLTISYSLVAVGALLVLLGWLYEHEFRLN